MPGESAIAWTDETWNWGAWACTEVSPGCDECYARVFTQKQQALLARGVPHIPEIYRLGWSPARRMIDAYEEIGRPDLWRKRLFWPFTVRKPGKRIFVNSMTDYFHSVIPEQDILWGLEVMRQCDWLHFQILTKRAGRLMRLGAKIDATVGWPSNVAVGVSIENALYRPRMRALWRGTRTASVRFVSYEPALDSLEHDDPDLRGNDPLWEDLASYGVSWLICGAESGDHARPFSLDWAREARNACGTAGTRFFFKQVVDEHGKKHQLPPLDGRVWDEQPDALNAWHPVVPDAKIIAHRKHELESRFGLA